MTQIEKEGGGRSPIMIKI